MRFTAIVWLMVFVLGVTASGFAHTSQEREEISTEHHCVMHCGCHTISAPALPAARRADLPVQEFVLADEQLKLPLLAASIFKPPKS